MAQAIISRRGGGSGSGYATITFNGVSALKRTGAAALVWPRQDLAATAVGDYALFAGGYDGSYSATVDAYYVNNKVQVYSGTIYKLGSMSSESTSPTMQEIETTAPIT